MAINNVGIGASVLGPSVLALKNQLGSLQEQMASGKKASTYAGMGVNEGFAVAARARLSNISAFADTMTKVTTNINVANTALQSLSDIGNNMEVAAGNTEQALNSNGQTMAQQTAAGNLSSM